MIPIIEQHDGYWYVSVGGERLGEFKSKIAAQQLSDKLTRRAFSKGWEATINARRKRLRMTHDGS